MKLGSHHTEKSKRIMGKNNWMLGRSGIKHPSYGKPLSKATKDKIRKSHLGKHLSAATKKKISIKLSGKLSPMFGKHSSEATKLKIKLHHVDVGGKNHPMFGKHHSEATKKKMSKNTHQFGKKNPMYGKKLSKASREKISKANSGENNYWYGKSPSHGKREYYKGICMRSSWEVNIAKWLDKQNWGWLYEPKRFILKNKTYLPDFYLPDLNVYWEIKGWFHERHQETVRQFRELYPYEKLVVITKEIYKKIIIC